MKKCLPREIKKEIVTHAIDSPTDTDGIKDFCFFSVDGTGRERERERKRERKRERNTYK